MRSYKVCIVCNPMAGYGKSAKMLPEIVKDLGRLGVFPDVFSSEYPKHSVELAKGACRSGYQIVVAMGGDGTVGEVANGILTSGIPGVAMGVIPAGTGNDFVAGNRLFTGTAEALETLSRPQFRNMDVILYSDASGQRRYAMNSFGIGYDAYVVKRVSELSSRRLGHFSYMLEALRGLVRFNPAALAVKITESPLDGSPPPGRELESVWLFAVVNSERFGGGMKVCPGANSWDGRIDYAFLAGMSRLGLVKLIFLVRSGKHIGQPGVFRGQAQEVTFFAPAGFPCHLDGDTVDAVYPATVKVLPAALPLVVSELGGRDLTWQTVS